MFVMKKAEAIEQLGGTVKLAAQACEISPSAISQWPEDLTKDQVVRVQAALYRKQQAELAGAEAKATSAQEA